MAAMDTSHQDLWSQSGLAVSPAIHKRKAIHRLGIPTLH